MNASPHPMAANRILVLLNKIRLEYSCEELIISDVTRRIIDVAASHMLRSERVKGIFI
jgi:hypothetical protein